MSFLGELISEVIFEGILSAIEHTGAFVHWLIRGKRRPYKEVVEHYFGINLLLSFLLYGTLGVIAWQFF